MFRNWIDQFEHPVSIPGKCTVVRSLLWSAHYNDYMTEKHLSLVQNIVVSIVLLVLDFVTTEVPDMSHQGLSGTSVGPHTSFLSQSQDSITVSRGKKKRKKKGRVKGNIRNG